MKKILNLLFIVLLLSSPVSAADYYGGTGGGVSKDTNCNQAKYYPIGKVCADTDDGKLYKGTGSAVVEIGNSITGLTDASNVAITGGTINGTPIGATTPAAGTFTDLAGNVAVITDSATGNVTAAQMKGQTHRITGAYTLSLPTAAAGYKAKFRATTAAVFSLDVVTGTDVIRLNGNPLSAGYKVTSDGTINNTIECESDVAGKYECNSLIGLAIDGGA